MVDLIFLCNLGGLIVKSVHEKFKKTPEEIYILKCTFIKYEAQYTDYVFFANVIKVKD